MKTANWLAALAFSFAAAPLAADAPLKPAKLMVVPVEPMGLERQFFGQVAAKQSVDLAFQVGGQVVEFPVIEGGTVAKGDLIARLDQEQFELQRDQAKLQKEQADRTVQRLSKLSGTTVSQVTLDDAETQAGLTKIALRNAEWALEHATLQAPFEGLVSSRNVDLFATVSAGTPVVRIHDMSELRIEVNVPEILFQRTGNEGQIEISARFPSSDTEYPLQIREFDAETSNVGQTIRVTFGMAPPEGLSILPGSSVTVSAKVIHDEEGIVVPPTALVINDTGDIGVMQFEPAGADTGTVRWVPVQIQPTQSGKSQIISGLNSGAEIVEAGGGALTDGQSVRRFVGFGN